MEDITTLAKIKVLMIRQRTCFLGVAQALLSVGGIYLPLIPTCI